jgi:uncharacterized repeat protein (TIGR02543 family)
MKKITLLIVSMLMVTLLAMAQIKFIVYKADGSTIKLLATEVDSIGFEGNNEQPENPDKPYIPNANGHEYVDLGLPSGTLWATMNVGATSAEDYGDYFCWGETTPKSSYTESNYTYSGKSNKLHLSSDAAYVNWGENWRMPTYRELLELEDAYYTTWTWTSLNGVNGYKVTSIVNGNSIFLPAAGYRDGSDLNYARAGGFYWSISKYEGDGDAIMSLNFNSRDISISSGADRSTGLSVRPVLRDVEPTYTLRFDANGGEGAISSIIVENGDWVTIPTSTFTRENYRFKGWSTEADGSGNFYKDSQTFSVSSDITLYAQWKKTGGVDIPEDMPILSNPGEGKTTLCVYIPNSECDEAIPYAIGELPGGGWGNFEALKMKRCEDRECWWEVTLDALNEENATNFKFRMDDGKNSWTYEPRATYEVIPADYLKVKEDEDKNLVAIANCDNQVLYIQCGKWDTPCIEYNKAGEATFTLTALAPLPEGFVVGIVGNLSSEQYWNIESPIIMTQNGNTYTATCTVGDACQYKYIVSLDGGVTWSWEYSEYANRYMPLDLKAIDTIKSWWFEEIPDE